MKDLYSENYKTVMKEIENDTNEKIFHADGLEEPILLKCLYYRGVWVAQLVKHLTLDLSSGLDLRVMSLSPVLDSTLEVEPTFKKKKVNATQIHVQLRCNAYQNTNSIFFLKKRLYLFIRERERQSAREGTQAEGAGEEEAGSQKKSLTWGLIPEFRDHGLSRRQALNY